MNIKSNVLSISQDVISYMINLYLISIFKLRLPAGISSFLKNEIDSIKSKIFEYKKACQKLFLTDFN
jgi:hypothetical protein